MSVYFRTIAVIIIVFCGGLVAAQSTGGGHQPDGRSEIGNNLPPANSGAERDLLVLVETGPKKIDSIMRSLAGKGDPNEVLSVGERDDYLHNLGIVASIDPQIVGFDRLLSIIKRVEGDPAMPAQVKADYLEHAYLTIGRFGSQEAIQFLLERTEIRFWEGNEPHVPFNPPMRGFLSPRLQAIASINVLGNEAENELLRRLKQSPDFKDDVEALQYIQVALDAAEERRNDHLALLAAARNLGLVARPPERQMSGNVAAAPLMRAKTATIPAKPLAPANPVAASGDKIRRFRWPMAGCFILLVGLMVFLFKNRTNWK